MGEPNRTAVATRPALVPAFAARSGPLDFFLGFVLPFRAAGLIFRTRKLFGLAALSAVITFASLFALLWLLGVYVDDLLRYFWATPESWYGKAGWYLVLVLAFVGLLVAGANTVPLLLQAPLQDPLSEATEEACGGFIAPPFSVGGLLKGVGVSLGHTVARIATLIAGQAALFLLNFIPGIGSLLWTVLGAAWTMVWAAGEYLGAPMARQLYPFTAVRRVLRERRTLTLGFGAAVFVVLWIPVLNLFFIPMAIVGGTLLYRGLRACGGIPPPPAASPAASP